MAFWDGAGSGLVGGLISYFGGESSNAANAANVAATNASNERIAWLNNQTMIDLANTAHQREVKDLVAAGLNPVLSVDGAGAPVPALTSARMESYQRRNTLGEAAATGLNQWNSARNLSQQSQLNEANIDVARAQAKNLDVQNQKLRAEIEATRANTYKTYADTETPGVLGKTLRDVNGLFGSTPGQRWVEKEFGTKDHPKSYDLGTTTIKAHRAHSAKDLPYIGSFFK